MQDAKAKAKAEKAEKAKKKEQERLAQAKAKEEGVGGDSKKAKLKKEAEAKKVCTSLQDRQNISMLLASCKISAILKRRTTMRYYYWRWSVHRQSWSRLPKYAVHA